MESGTTKNKPARFNVSWSSVFLKKIDRYIELTGNNRSNFLAEAAKAYIEQESKKILSQQSFLDQATAGELIEQITSIIEQQSDSAWVGRTIAFIAALIRPLVLLRDKKYEPLTLGGITYYFDYDNIDKLIERFENDNSLGEARLVINPLKAYMTTLPNYNPALPLAKQSHETKEAFGYVTMFLLPKLKQ